MTKIKICGITNFEDAQLALEAGADVLGFIFSSSPRKIKPEKAKEIIQSLPPFFIKMGIFIDEPKGFVEDVDDFCRLDFLQFHGNESPEYVKSFGRKGMKAFRVKGMGILKEIERYEADFFLLDSERSGEIFDWKIAAKAKKSGNFFLGGGLNPSNVFSVLLAVSPFGVDVCSGVEAFPGRKDPIKIKDFIWRVRKWDLTQGGLAFLEEDLSPKS